MARASHLYIPGFIWHGGWIEAELERSGGGRQPHWTENIAVGGRTFVEAIQQRLSHRSLGRRKRPLTDGMELRESMAPYSELFEAEKAAIDTVR